jgi:hypothetical protein
MTRLPDSLQALGTELEAATGRAVRRRARRHAFATGAGTVLLALPLAVAVGAEDLAPDGRELRFPVATPSATVDTTPKPRRLPIGAPAPARPAPCLGSALCAVPLPPSQLLAHGRT